MRRMPERNGKRTKVLRAALVAALGLGVIGWIFFAPTQLGGSVDYVVIDGDSMEPLLHADDLSLVRHSDEYRVGDVAAYHSPKLGRTVLHRIKAIEDGRYVFKGDNNNFIDPERPTRAALIGTLQMNIPSAGRAFRFVAGPLGAAVVAAVIAAIVAMNAPRRRRNENRMVETAEPESTLGNLIRPNRRMLFAAGVAFVLFAGLSFSAFTRDPYRVVTRPVSYEHEGTFGYEARVDKGSVTGRTAGNGQPIYFSLSDQLDTRFRYHFSAEEKHSVSGKGRLVTRLESDTGWARTVETGSVRSIKKGRLELSQRVDLGLVRDLLRKVQTETGVSASFYFLTFSADLGITGRVAGQQLADDFSPSLRLQVDDSQLILQQAQPGETGDALAPTQSGSVQVERSQPNAISLLWLSFDVEPTRIVAAAGLSLSLLALILFGWVYLRALRGDEKARFEALYGDFIVRVKPGQITEAIEVESMEALVRLAGSYDAMILHEQDGASNAYFVLDQGRAYCYRSGDEEVELAELIPLFRAVRFVEELEETRDQ